MKIRNPEFFRPWRPKEKRRKIEEKPQPIRDYKRGLPWDTPAAEYIDPLWLDLLADPHLLIAGTTGSGKSTSLNALLWAAHHQPPDKVRFLYIDLKRVELRQWEMLPHCIGYADTVGAAIDGLRRICSEMGDRFEEMQSRGDKETTRGHIYIVVDEMADLRQKSPKKSVELLSDVARLGRAAHIHLILCTQSPQRTQAGGLPAAVVQNITTRVALRCMSSIESRQAINAGGAEKLPRHGQCLVMRDGYIAQTAAPYIEPKKTEQIIEHWESQI